MAEGSEDQIGQIVVAEKLDVDALVAAYSNQLALSNWMKVTVKDPKEQITTMLKFQDTYVVYKVQTNVFDRTKLASAWVNTDMEEFPDTIAVWRRYSEFDLLKEYLVATYPTAVIPPLPEKRTTSAWQAAVVDRTNPEFIERRRAGLQQFLQRLTRITEMAQETILLGFLRNQESWKEEVLASHYQSKSDSKLRMISASYRIKNPNEKFEALIQYATQLEGHISSMLKTRAKTTEFLYGTHKIHSNYGREFSLWSSMEQGDLAESLQKMGHYMDVFSQDIDISRENEEDLADLLKEYYGYCNAVRTVCRKQELLHLELEQSGDALQAKRIERDNLSQGKTSLLGSLKARMFGGNTPEQKEDKLRTLDEQILEAEEKNRTLNINLEKFDTTAMKNLDAWRMQKVQEINEIMLNFIITAIDRCRKSRATWVNIKAACNAVKCG